MKTNTLVNHILFTRYSSNLPSQGISKFVKRTAEQINKYFSYYLRLYPEPRKSRTQVLVKSVGENNVTCLLNIISHIT